MTELVSVYIPTHNRSSMLRRAIESVLNQSYTNVEIIVSDDGSDDDTENVVKCIMVNNENVRYIKNPRPMGACHARNQAINLARGVYITGLDDDDEFTEDRIQKLIYIAKKKSNYSFISSGIKRIEKNGIGYNYITPRELTSKMIKNSNCVGNQVFIKTEYLIGVGGFDENLVAWQDYDCWFRLILRYGPAYNCAQFSYIMHTEHDAGRITKSNKVKSAVDYFIRKHRESLSMSNLKNIKFNFILYYTNDNKFSSLMKNLTFNNLMLFSRYVVSNALNFIRNKISIRRGRGK